jgi:hypothetical protein
MRVPAEKPEAFRTAGGGAADSGLEQQDACKDQSLLPLYVRELARVGSRCHSAASKLA